MLLSWGKRPVHVYLGSLGHHGWIGFHIGRLVLRIHPYLFLLRAGVCDTAVTPTRRQYIAWCVAGLAASATLMLTGATLAWRDPWPGYSQLFWATVAFLGFTDFGFSIFRELQPVQMQSGMVYVGIGATLRDLIRYRSAAIDFLLGVRHYMRDDYRSAMAHYCRVEEAGIHSEELLEDMMFAAYVLKDYPAVERYYAALNRHASPNATQKAILSQALWCQGEQREALSVIGEALGIARGHPLACNFRAWMMLELGEPEAALEDLESATTLTEDYAAAWLNKSRALTMLNRRQEALAAATTAFKLDPIDPAVLEGYAAMLETEGLRLDFAAELRDRLKIMRGL